VHLPPSSDRRSPLASRPVGACAPHRAPSAPLAGLLLLAACAPQPVSSPPVPTAPADRIEASVFLIGDTGEPAPEFEPVLHALRTQLARLPDRSVVVFLGDNLYPDGLPDSAHPERAEHERRLDDQLEVLRATGVGGGLGPRHPPGGGRGGGRPRPGGAGAAGGGGGPTPPPRPACPGPAVVDPDLPVRLVLLDTQWWLSSEPRAATDTLPCAHGTEGEVAGGVRAAIREAGDRRVVVAAHHPIRSGGTHAGRFPLHWHLFPLRQVNPDLWVPLPGVGTAWILAQRMGIRRQDLSSSAYRVMRDSLGTVLAERPPLTFAAGHDHNLQVIEDPEAGLLLVSGAGIHSNTRPVQWIDGTRFASDRAGFIRLDLLRSGRVRLAVVTVDRAGEGEEAFSAWIR
jgi:hypothetical protein